MMIFLFLGIIVLGLGAFAFVFLKEFKSGELQDDEPQKAAPLRASDVQAVPGQEADPLPTEEVSGGILGERYKKLEQMLDEKSHLVVQLQQDLDNERSHRGEFDSLKDILQRQIEDLKAQNKRVKEDLARALQDNIEQQSRHSSIATAIASAGEAASVAPEPSEPVLSLQPEPTVLDLTDKSSEQFEQFFNKDEEATSSLSLHDIFEKKDKSA